MRPFTGTVGDIISHVIDTTVQVNSITSTTGITLGEQFLNIFSRKERESCPEHTDIYGMVSKKYETRTDPLCDKAIK